MKSLLLSIVVLQALKSCVICCRTSDGIDIIILFAARGPKRGTFERARKRRPCERSSSSFSAMEKSNAILWQPVARSYSGFAACCSAVTLSLFRSQRRFPAKLFVVSSSFWIVLVLISWRNLEVLLNNGSMKATNSTRLDMSLPTRLTSKQTLVGNTSR